MNTATFLSLYMASVNNFHAEMKAPATDLALSSLLDVHKEAIIKENAIEADPTGFDFHKSFRQELLSCGRTQTAIWFLLQDAPLFRMLIEDKKELFPDANKTRDDYFKRK